MKSIACGTYHSIGITEDGTMDQWGSEDLNQYKDFPEGVKVKAVSAGRSHSVALTEDGSILQWGMLPRGPKKPHGVASLDGLKLKAISCGFNHTVGLMNDGTIVQWGSEVTGEASFFPKKSIKAKMVSAGHPHNVAITTSGDIVEWGSTTSDIFEKVVHNPPKDKVKYVSSGYFHSVAIREDGSLLQWILKDNGQGNGFPTEGIYKAVSCGFTHSVAIKEDGTIVQWGDSTKGQMKDFPPADIKVKEVACGMHHSVAILEDGRVIQWGDDDKDQREDMPGFVMRESNARRSGISPLKSLEDSYADALKPNPYPQLATKIAGDVLSTGTFSYNKNTTAFNATMYENVSLESGMKDEENPLIVKVGNNYSIINRDYIRDTIKDFSGIRYACNKILGLAVYPNNIYGKNPLYYMKGLAGGSNFLVVLSEIQTVLDKNIKAIELVPGIELKAVSSFLTVYDDGDYNFLGELVDSTGKDHCQKGSTQMLYRIKVLEEVTGGSKQKMRKNTQKKRNNLRRKTTKRKQH